MKIYIYNHFKNTFLFYKYRRVVHTIRTSHTHNAFRKRVKCTIHVHVQFFPYLVRIFTARAVYR